jgi:hypothetical protein
MTDLCNLNINKESSIIDEIKNTECSISINATNEYVFIHILFILLLHPFILVNKNVYTNIM